MGMLLIAIAYLVYAAFWVRLSLHTLIWYRAARDRGTRHPGVSGGRLLAASTALMDIIFFRRLFSSNKLLWHGSWAFHAAFLLVVLRHLRYFLEPVPECISDLQIFGIVAGYVLVAALAYTALLRALPGRRYVYYQNYLVLGLLFLIGATGLLMRNFFRPDLVDVKSFIMGLVAFRPVAPPGNLLFIVHFSLVLLLVPYLPFHIFTAPVIAIEARRRQQGLDMVMHDKR